MDIHFYLRQDILRTRESLGDSLETAISILDEGNSRREALLRELGVIYDRHPNHGYLRIGQTDRGNPNTRRKYSTNFARGVVTRAVDAFINPEPAEPDEPDESDDPDESDEPDEPDEPADLSGLTIEESATPAEPAEPDEKADAMAAWVNIKANTWKDEKRHYEEEYKVLDDASDIETAQLEDHQYKDMRRLDEYLNREVDLFPS